MSEATQPRYGVDPYLDWVKKEGLPVAEDYALDLFEVETAEWPRYGVKGAAAHLKGRGDFCNMFVLELLRGNRRYRNGISMRTCITCWKAAAARKSNLRTGRSAASSGVPKACSQSRSTRNIGISTAAGPSAPCWRRPPTCR